MLHTENVRVRQRVYSMEAAGILREQGRAPAHPIQFRSQFGEDMVIWDILGRPLSGFFIEAGAFDGYSFSATYALEAVGWTGLLVEAIPDRCRQCAARRPASRVVHAALSRPGAPPTADLVVTQDDYGGMLSYLASAPPGQIDPGVAAMRSSRVSVPVATLTDLLKDHTGDVDAVVLDVEGAETDALRGFDLLRFRPKVLVVEDNAAARDATLAQYMTSQPYVDAGWIEMSRLYVRRDLTDVQARVNLT